MINMIYLAATLLDVGHRTSHQLPCWPHEHGPMQQLVINAGRAGGGGGGGGTTMLCCTLYGHDCNREPAATIGYYESASLTMMFSNFIDVELHK